MFASNNPEVSSVEDDEASRRLTDFLSPVVSLRQQTVREQDFPRSSVNDMWLEPKQMLSEPVGTMGRSSCGSEVVMIDDRVIEAAARSQPAVTNLNVTRSSRVHVGPKFVSIVQNVDNTSVVKGRILGLELVSPQNTKRSRFRIAIIVCTAFVVASIIIFCIIYFTLTKKPSRLDLDVHETWYLRRADWQAKPELGIEILDLPVPNVLIGHSVTDICSERHDCINKVLAIQKDHHGRDWYDIGPNFLVGGNGLVFEGRGANILGVMVAGWNRFSITIMFIGNYVHHEPNQVQFDNVNVLLKELVTKGVLSKTYTVYGHCQALGGGEPPGRILGLELVSPQNTKRLRCSIAVFVCWAFIVASALTFCIFYFALAKKPSRLDLDLPLPRYLWHLVKNTTKAERISCTVAIVILVICIILIVYFSSKAKNPEQVADVAPHEWFITRDMWLAQKYNNTNISDEFEPLRLVIIAHTVSTVCTVFVNCAAEMRNLQGYFINTLSYDIPYNFLIGNDGRVYEGRGWNVVGAHTFGYNICSLGVAFVGDYREGFTQVTDLQLQRALMLFDEGVKQGYLHNKFEVVGAKDLQTTLSPGTHVYNEIIQWPNYARNNIYKNRNCIEIYNQFNIDNTTSLKTTKDD